MENLQTLNDFPIIDIWVGEDGNELVNTNHKYIFQDNVIIYDYYSLVFGFFSFLFKPYTQSINIKKRNIDNIDSSHINIVVVPCPDPYNVIRLLQSITIDLYNWCESNNIKIAICVTRETIYNLKNVILDSTIKYDLINCGFKSSIVKIINNSFQDLPDLINVEYIVSVDMMRRTLRFILANTNIQLSKNRTYNFSLLTGVLYQRPNRIIFLSECYNLNILDDKFFYSICMLDEEKHLKYIKTLANNYKNPSIILNASNSIFKHKTYGITGELLTTNSIYDDNIEFFIPPQVLDSYIHIVLETVDHVPSLTEKIFKPIVAGLPFIWHGCQNILPYLESLGFKRYDGIDYSFDSDPNPERRMDLLIEEVRRLNKVDLKSLALSNIEVSKHNQQVFQSICRDYNDLWDQLK